MRNEHESRSHDHPYSSLSDLVHQCSEQRGEEDGEERYHCKQDRCDVKIHSEQRQENGHSELLEAYHAAIEGHAKYRDHQEARVAEHFQDVGETELVLFCRLHLVSLTRLPVKSGIHGHEYSP